MHFSLAYYSNALHPFNEEALFDLAEQASLINKSHDVTGFLQYRNNHFFQYLEGKREQVLLIGNNISQDSRHSIQWMVHLPLIEVRRFSDWYMRYITPQEIKSLQLESLLDENWMEVEASEGQEDILKRSSLQLIVRIADVYPQQGYLY